MGGGHPAVRCSLVRHGSPFGVQPRRNGPTGLRSHCGHVRAALARRRHWSGQGWDLRPWGSCALYALSSKSSIIVAHRDLAAVHEQPSRHRDRASAVLASLGRVPPAHPWRTGPRWVGFACLAAAVGSFWLAFSPTGSRPFCSILVRGQRAWPIRSSTKKRSAPPTWSVKALYGDSRRTGSLSLTAGIIGSNHRSPS